MKKGICILLAMILLLASVGCAGEGEVTASSKAGASSRTVSGTSTGEASSEAEASTEAGTSSLTASDGSTAASSGEASTNVVSVTLPLANINGTATFALTGKADTKTVLRNPDKGWYLHYYDNGTYNYGANKSADYILGYMPYLDHIYIRLPWSTLEPQEGKFKWDVIDKVINDFTSKGVGVAFRITCKEGGDYCPYATPEWVKNAGAAGKMLDDKSWEPDFGDPIFLEKLENFHKAFAARYGGKDYVRYIDVGSYGMYGEGHNSGGSGKSWSWTAIRKHCDIYAKCYPNDQIVLSDDFIGSGHVSAAGSGGKKIRDYVAEHGWSWRDDSICVDWFMKNYAATDSVRTPKLFEEVWQTSDVVLELEHYHWVITDSPKDNKVNHWNNGSTLKAASKRTHATYAGWHGFIDKFMVGGNVAYAEEMANLLGYWLFLDKADLSCTDGTMTCKFTWRNEGFANAHNKYDLDLILTDSKGKDAIFALKDFDCTQIMPKDAADENAVTPALTTKNAVALNGLMSGEYTVSIRMHKGNTPILLALNSSLKGSDGRYTLGKITLK
ncbi:MAG: DUF4832 domain-containing protein [Clostridia bacterium]|nr:DUF4832 domain-containing protein [Clostridia bacterium]